jgi:hypothetical protein
MDHRVEPFRYVAGPAALADLRERLRRARWPEPATTDGWQQGVPLDVLQALCARWADGYDWRPAERWLNEAGASRTRVDRLDLHLLHVRSPHPGRHHCSSRTAGPGRCSSPGTWSGP